MTCEWNPQLDRPAFNDDEYHATAVWSIGNGKWHLCDACSKLPEFKRFRKKEPLRRKAKDEQVDKR